MRLPFPLLQVKPEKLRKLPPAFVKEGGHTQGGSLEGGSQEGTVTAGNSSIIADGAAALVLVSAERASELGLRVCPPAPLRPPPPPLRPCNTAMMGTADAASVTQGCTENNCSCCTKYQRCKHEYCVCANMRLCMSVCLSVCMCVCVCLYACVSVYLCVCLCVCLCVSVCLCVCVSVSMYTCRCMQSV